MLVVVINLCWTLLWVIPTPHYPPTKLEHSGYYNVYKHLITLLLFLLLVVLSVSSSFIDTSPHTATMTLRKRQIFYYCVGVVLFLMSTFIYRSCLFSHFLSYFIKVEWIVFVFYHHWSMTYC